MEIELASILFGWLLHVDLTCIVCNWDPASQSWVPYTAGGLGAAAGTGLGLNDLFGPFHDLPTLPYPPWDPEAGPPHPEDLAGLGEPVDPFRQAVPPGNPPPLPADYSDRSDPDARAATEEAERQSDRDDRHTRHPEDSVAGPPSSGPTYEEQAGHFFNRGIRKRITGE